jgi:hypothetical protein
LRARALLLMRGLLTGVFCLWRLTTDVSRMPNFCQEMVADLADFDCSNPQVVLVSKAESYPIPQRLRSA